MDIEPGELLFSDDFPTGAIDDRWEVTGGEWRAENGVLTGCYRGNGGGLIYSRAPFPGDIILEFTGRMVPPCDNDLNFTFRADGWDYARNDASIGYIGGLKKVQYKTLMATKPELAMEQAIKGMLPKNTLGAQAYARLKVYAGEAHKHEAQKPEAYEF